MSELTDEVKAQLITDIQNGDAQALKNIYSTIGEVFKDEKNPNVVEVEFTLTQIEFLDQVKRDLNQPSKASILRLIVDNFMPAYEASKKMREKT